MTPYLMNTTLGSPSLRLAPTGGKGGGRQSNLQKQIYTNKARGYRFTEYQIVILYSIAPSLEVSYYKQMSSHPLKISGNLKNPIPKQHEKFLETLKRRFVQNAHRHQGIQWDDVRMRLMTRPDKLGPLFEMEKTGGEPDVVGQDKTSGEYLFYDCSEESPGGRTSLCYDRAALQARKEFKPKGNAMDTAFAMGVELLTEAEYMELQKLGPFDKKSSSWLKTPPDIRELGGALYGEVRYGRFFLGHNGAQSYYSRRGFRSSFRI